MERVNIAFYKLFQSIKTKIKPAEEIFKEVGQEIKWVGASSIEATHLNWYLTQIIASLDHEEYEFQIPADKLEVLNKEKWFLKLVIRMKLLIVQNAGKNYKSGMVLL